MGSERNLRFARAFVLLVLGANIILSVGQGSTRTLHAVGLAVCLVGLYLGARRLDRNRQV